MREEKDRGGKWLIEHHGNSVLFLGGITGYESWRAAHTAIVVPERLPDGLLEIIFTGEPTPHPVLVEIATYPDSRATEQALDDALLVFLSRRVIPEVLTIVLHPKGNLQVTGQHQRRSRLGLTDFQVTWKVVELWKVPAATLLAANDVGLIPLVPLTQFDSPPEAIVQLCRERIDQQARPEEHNSLLAVTQVFTRLRFQTPQLFAILGGRRIMIESPLIQELITEHDLDRLHKVILRILSVRFGTIPEEMASAVRAIQQVAHLEDLMDWALQCPDLEAFRSRLSASSP